jgi:signal transduction histidine kinase
MIARLPGGPPATPGGRRPPGEEEIAARRHVLRTPLNHILGYGELLREEAEDRALQDLTEDLCAVQELGRCALAAVDRAFARSPGSGSDLDPERLRSELRPTVALIVASCASLRDLIEGMGHLDLIADVEKIRAASVRLLELAGAQDCDTPGGRDDQDLGGRG